MKVIRGYEEAVRMIGKFEFDEFRLVEKMTFRVIESTTSPVQVLELHMHTDRRDRAARIRLRFIGVANLKIDSWPPGQVTLASDTAEKAEAQIVLGGKTYVVAFNKTGDVGGHIKITDAAGKVLADRDFARKIEQKD